ncbi:hypothetical protein M9Y10_022638 [Tritrichomonas musculus]|uniref:Cilia- and flagella-associated protein 157 n=1 Tax=Tritrichomonas musculus TaxID=1915356 RepID=A0ABR2KSV8_9EUKA
MRFVRKVLCAVIKKANSNRQKPQILSLHICLEFFKSRRYFKLMPGKKAAKPINNIPYGKKGVLPATVANFERENLQKIEEKDIADYAKTKNNVNSAVITRRIEQRKDEVHQLDFDDVKKYLSLKIRDKEEKIQFYQNKLRDTRKEKEDLIAKFQIDQEKLKQAHEVELSQLTNNLKANLQRKEALATVAAMEIQLNREIADAEATLKREKAQQSQQTSQVLAEFYMLHVKQQKELKESVEYEKEKNRSMTSQHLEKTVIDMMKDIDDEIRKYSALVSKTKDIAEINSKLIKTNKQKNMEKNLLKQECDAAAEIINKNDLKIRRLVEELKMKDQKFIGITDDNFILEDAENDKNLNESKDDDITQAEDLKADEIDKEKINQIQPEDNTKPQTDRKALLYNFFDNSVNTLCESIVKILGILEPSHKNDYLSFHQVFNTFDGKKKELRFLMSKIGNLSFKVDDLYRLPDIGVEEVEGVDEKVTAKKIVEPQQKAILEFAQPIAYDEFPELIATHFFQ